MMKPQTHFYLSTACHHALNDEDRSEAGRKKLHAYCQGDTGMVGKKEPAKCKFCEAKCKCPCHARLQTKHGDVEDGHIRDELANRRKQLGMTQLQLSTYMRCSQSQLAQLETGRVALTLPMLRRWVEALQYDLDLRIIEQKPEA